MCRRLCSRHPGNMTTRRSPASLRSLERLPPMRFHINAHDGSSPTYERTRSSRTSRSPRRTNAPRLEQLESRELLAISNLSAVNPITPSPIAGTSFTNALATFTSTDTSFNGIVNWGDGFASVGNSVSIVETNPATNTWTVSASHTYIAATIPGNPYPITISVTDNATPTVPPSVVYTSAIVNDAAITVTCWWRDSFRRSIPSCRPTRSRRPS